MRYLLPWFLFQTPSGGVFAVPQQIAVLIGHCSWDADLVAVEVVGLLAVSPSSVVQSRTWAKRGSRRNRCRYRYICRPKRIRFPLRGRLKNKNRVRATYTLRQD